MSKYIVTVTYDEQEIDFQDVKEVNIDEEYGISLKLDNGDDIFIPAKYLFARVRKEGE